MTDIFQYDPANMTANVVRAGCVIPAAISMVTMIKMRIENDRALTDAKIVGATNKARTLFDNIKGATLANAGAAAIVPNEIKRSIKGSPANVHGNHGKDDVDFFSTDGDQNELKAELKKWVKELLPYSFKYGKTADMKAGDGAWAISSAHRHNTILARTLVFIVNLQRSIRAKLQQDLTYTPSTARIIHSLPIANTRVTEFYGFDTARR